MILLLPLERWSVQNHEKFLKDQTSADIDRDGRW
jgi:hypothetical protein